MAVDRGEFDDAGFDLDSLNARIEHSLDGRHGTLDFQVLRFFSDDRKARGLEQLLGLGNNRGARTKLLFELCGGQPLMVAGRCRIRLTLQQPFKRIGIGQRKKDIEMRDAVWICSAERFGSLRCGCALRQRNTRNH